MCRNFQEPIAWDNAACEDGFEWSEHMLEDAKMDLDEDYEPR